MTGDGLRLLLRTRVVPREAAVAREPEAEGFDRSAALRAFERAVERSPGEADYHFVLGEALLRDGREEEALGALEVAARLRPDEAGYHLAAAEALWRLGRWEEAARFARRACDLAPEDADAWSALGAALAAVPIESSARAALGRALDLERRRIDATNNLSVLDWRSGARAEAIARLRAGSRRQPDPVALLNLARMLVATGAVRDGEKALDRAHRIDRDDPEPLLERADLQVASGRRREAAWTFEEALALSPSCLETRPESRKAYRELLQEAVRGELAPGPRGPLRSLRDGLADVAGRGAGALLDAGRGVVFVGALAGLAGCAHLGWQLGRPWVRHLHFRDDVVSVARAPVRDDGAVRERLRLAVRRHGLEEHVSPESCSIVTRPASRTIGCRYRLPLALYPGHSGSLGFELRVEEPYLAPEETLFF